MQVKVDEPEHDLKEETEHDVKDQHKREFEEWFTNLPIGAANQETDLLEQEIDNYWTNPEFLKLVNDSDFRQQNHKNCQKLISRFKASTICSCEDLEQIVIARFGRWYPSFRGQSKPRTALYRIARNALIDLSRKPDKKCDSYESLNLEQFCALATHGNVASIEYKILVQELLSKLNTHDERELFFENFVEGKTRSEIARQRGVSRQYVSKQLDKVINKLKLVVS